MLSILLSECRAYLENTKKTARKVECSSSVSQTGLACSDYRPHCHLDWNPPVGSELLGYELRWYFSDEERATENEVSWRLHEQSTYQEARDGSPTDIIVYGVLAVIKRKALPSSYYW